MKIESRLSNKICPEGMSIEDWQVALRREHAEQADFTVEHLDDNRIWGDYLVSSGSGRYRTAFRGVRSDRNFCSCLDFRTNGLGTCKHLEAVALYLQEHVEGYPWAGMTYNPPYSSIYVSYKGGRSIRMRLGDQFTMEYLQLYKKYFTEEGILPPENYHLLSEICEQARAISNTFRCYEDVEEFVREYIREETWRLELRNSFPEGMIPWDRVEYSAKDRYMEELLYQLCYRHCSLMVGAKSPNFAHLVARLVEEVYQGVEQIHQGYVVLDNEAEVSLWRSIMSLYQEFVQLPIRILTSSEFAALPLVDHPATTFVYVDNADRLKEWKNNVSVTIKKMHIEHLFMRIDTLRKLTPVQLSSILQHISPFVIGPFYKFIHKYRPVFPLLDDGSNMPEEALKYITLCTEVVAQSIRIPQTDMDATTRDVKNMTSQEKADLFVQSLLSVLEDPDACQILKERLSSL